MAFTVLGNGPMWYYRSDALQEAGVTSPRTVAAVQASSARLIKSGRTDGAVMRSERGNGIRYEWMQ